MLDHEADAAASTDDATAETAAAAPTVGADTTAEETDADEAQPDLDAPIAIDDLDGMSFEDAVDATIVAFEDGDLVHGTVVKI
ncbi:MAG: hypothetical protein ACKO1Y_05440, partial [Actinomycetota bacterium]